MSWRLEPLNTMSNTNYVTNYHQQEQWLQQNTRLRPQPHLAAPTRRHTPCYFRSSGVRICKCVCACVCVRLSVCLCVSLCVCLCVCIRRQLLAPSLPHSPPLHTLSRSLMHSLTRALSLTNPSPFVVLFRSKQVSKQVSKRASKAQEALILKWPLHSGFTE